MKNVIKRVSPRFAPAAETPVPQADMAEVSVVAVVPKAIESPEQYVTFLESGEVPSSIVEKIKIIPLNLADDESLGALNETDGLLDEPLIQEFEAAAAELYKAPVLEDVSAVSETAEEPLVEIRLIPGESNQAFSDAEKNIQPAVLPTVPQSSEQSQKLGRVFQETIASVQSATPVDAVSVQQGKAPERWHVIRSLSIIKLVKILFWPAIKVYGSIYAWAKLKIIRHKKQVYTLQFYEEAESVDGSRVVDVFAPTPEISFFWMSVPRNWAKVTLSFLVLSLLLALPFFGFNYVENILGVKDAMVQNSATALSHLEQGQASIGSMNLGQAAESFEMAKARFDSALQEFNSLDAVSRTLVRHIPTQGKNVQASLVLLEAGSNIAEAGKNLSETANQIMHSMADQSGAAEAALQKLSLLKNSLDFVIPKVALAQAQIEALDFSAGDLKRFEALVKAQASLPELRTKLQNVSDLTDALLVVLGHERWQRYLVVFQNQNELRATGGFMGSFALADVENGKITQLEIPGGGTYDLQGSLLATVQAPAPLRLINPVWEFQDANWWPDFPATAQKLTWFLEKSQWPSVNGVIAMTSRFMTDILAVVGPIEMPEYGRIITAENFVAETQQIVEFEYDKTINRPKQFLADLAPRLIEKITGLEENQKEKIFVAVYENLKRKDLMFYSQREEIQKIIEDFDWGGAQKDAQGGDYLSVISSNIGGGKSDGAMLVDYRLTTNVFEGGRMVNTLVIRRGHSGVPEDVLGGLQNNSYLRVYVPRGSKLISATGFNPPAEDLFETPPLGYLIDSDMAEYESEHLTDPLTRTEVYQENNKTVFANWLLTRPGETLEATLVYELPPLESQDKNIHTLIVQKQPGTNPIGLDYTFQIPDGMTVTDSYPALSPVAGGAATDPGSAHFYKTLETDAFFGMVLSR